jgi:hypothetical protein
MLRLVKARRWWLIGDTLCAWAQALAWPQYTCGLIGSEAAFSF